MSLEYIAEWFVFADRDLATAEYLVTMQPQPLEIICFHCQQAAEKYLKGFLLFKSVEPPKTHDLVDLNDMCADVYEQFGNMDKANAILTRYGVLPRYPQEIMITENDMHKAIEYTRQIRDFGPLAEVRRITMQKKDG